MWFSHFHFDGIVCPAKTFINTLSDSFYFYLILKLIFYYNIQRYLPKTCCYMKHSITFRIIGLLLLALVSYNYYACKKVDLERVPLVKVVDVDNITAVSAFVSGEVTDVGEGDVGEFGFVYGAGDFPTVADVKITCPEPFV